MAIVYSVLLSIFLSANLLIVQVSCEKIIAQEGKSFIVQVQNDMKPDEFYDVRDWYESILKSLSSKTLAQSDKEIIHVYKTVFHGFSTRLTPQQVQQLKNRPEIVGVLEDKTRRILTTRSPRFLGLIKDAKPSNDILKQSDYGSNVIIGVLDSGVWPERQSFHDKDLDPIPSHWKGVCEGGEDFPKTLCNKKLIGVRYFHSNLGSNKNELENVSARDNHGHGTHTASTIAGRSVDNASLLGFAKGEATGIAEKARLAIYKVCWGAICMESDVLAGMDKAVADGVNVLSLSLGASQSEPYSMDAIAIGSFGAMEKGVLVSAAAGNSGFSGETVTNVAPWITTVGASTIDRKFPADLVLDDETVITGASLYKGKTFSNKTYFPLIYMGSETEPGTCMSLNPDEVRGKIVVCDRGDTPRAAKGVTVKNAGGVGVVLVNSEMSGESLIADAHLIPGLAITASARQKLLRYLKSAATPRATMVFRNTELGAKPAPVVAAFSSRGPNPQSIYIIKPDLIAPGVNILAAWTNDSSPTEIPEDPRRAEFNIISGTSMACPHVSGVAALLKGAHSEWSPAMIRSAMLTTAYTKDRDGNPLLDEKDLNKTTVWDMGAGHVDPQKALDPGLVYDLTVKDYLDFLCASNCTADEIKLITKRTVNCSEGKIRNPWDLNYPTISVAFDTSGPSKLEASVMRTVMQVSDDDAATYSVRIINPKDAIVTVDPKELVFKTKGEKQSYTIHISGKNKTEPYQDWHSEFGQLTWTDGKHEVTSPIAVTWNYFDI
ncbi:Subtilisin-like protease [Melia azedarach]|uniref:Subtilisin-like protease n=1 Tax=Melia azedarach TaxID=155640 RepID=A0ACC1YAM2_MELAZ|nr:Subtilisin-like protease [Melia azedarach]